MSLCLEDHFYVSIQCTLCQSPRQKHWVILMIWVMCATVLLLLICINYSLIAQSVERRTVNPQVAGSSPARGANIHEPHSDVGLFVLLRNSGFAPQNVKLP